MSFIDATNDENMYLQTKNNKIKQTTVDNKMEMQMFLNNIPSPSHGYRFSQQQRAQQIQFFCQSYHRHLPKIEINLFKATIIAVRTYLPHIQLYSYDKKKMSLIRKILFTL